MLYPMNVNISGMRCVIVGGGRVAARKATGLLEAGAVLTVIAPSFSEKLMALEGPTLRREPYRRGLLGEIRPRIVFLAATAEVNRLAAREAREIGALINDATGTEAREAGTFLVPSRIRRDPLLVTVSTGGVSPAFSRFLREYLEGELPETVSAWLSRLAVLREEAKAQLTPSGRQKMWRAVFTPGLLSLIRSGELDQAEKEVRHAISSFRAEP